METKRRDTPPRFKVGGVVQIARSHPALSGCLAKVVELRQSLDAESLDKYLVIMTDSGEEQLLWDIEVSAVPQRL
jgi:hypothetical protein